MLMQMGDCGPLTHALTVSDEPTDVQIFPNPVTGQLQLSASYPVDHLQNHDAFGRIVDDRPFVPTTEFTLRTGQYPAGVYFVTVYQGSYRVTRKIVKQ